MMGEILNFLNNEYVNFTDSYYNINNEEFPKLLRSNLQNLMSFDQSIIF